MTLSFQHLGDEYCFIYLSLGWRGRQISEEGNGGKVPSPPPILLIFEETLYFQQYLRLSNADQTLLFLGGIKKHYTRFIVEAIALDRFANRVDPTTNTISNRWYASNPMRLICIMYELTEAICHNYWYGRHAANAMILTDSSHSTFSRQ